MGTLDQGQDSVQLLSGHMVWKSQGWSGHKCPLRTCNTLTNQPHPRNLQGSQSILWSQGSQLGGGESFETFMKAQDSLLRKLGLNSAL